MIEEKTMGITTTLKKTYPRKGSLRGGHRTSRTSAIGCTSREDYSNVPP